MLEFFGVNFECNDAEDAVTLFELLKGIERDCLRYMKVSEDSSDTKTDNYFLPSYITLRYDEFEDVNFEILVGVISIHRGSHATGDRIYYNGIVNADPTESLDRESFKKFMKIYKEKLTKYIKEME